LGPSYGGLADLAGGPQPACWRRLAIPLATSWLSPTSKPLPFSAGGQNDINNDMTVAIYLLPPSPVPIVGEVKRSEWVDVGSPGCLKKIILIIVIVVLSIVSGVMLPVFCAIVGPLAGIGDHILQTLNETGFTIPASDNYVAPIEILASSACLMLRTVSGVPLIMWIILVVVVIGTIVMVKTLLKCYGGLGA